MKIIVGLGNPGDEYIGTRHNVGFEVVEALTARQKGQPSWKSEKTWSSDVCKIGDTIYMKPTTFMNNSGQAVAAVVNYYKANADDLWVIHDDLDLPLGKAQIRFGGGTAGHHGLESLIEHLKTSNFGRVRVGIRGDELRQFHAETGIDTNDFVMGKFSRIEQDKITRVIEHVVSMFDPDNKTVVNIAI